MKVYSYHIFKNLRYLSIRANCYFQISFNWEVIVGVFITTGNVASVKDLLDLGEIDINARGKRLFATMSQQ